MGKPVIGLQTWQIEPPQATGREIIYAGTPAAAASRAWDLIAG